jgi:hypothetical protein
VCPLVVNNRGNDPTDFAGLILVKEVLQFWRCPETPRVSQLSLRPFPRLPADTPMFDMLRFFQVRSWVMWHGSMNMNLS